MSLINMSSVNFDSKMFLNQIQNNTIDNSNKNLNESDKVNFTDVLNNAVNKVNDSQVKANNDIEALIKGDDITMHEVMLSTQEAQISMQLMLEMRNKLYDAYKELSSVQL
ncbi:flagellar hook-basal body complex protein FliE [uncultured Romboutsia sp.]|uniref:flagellar hook-basal body complex protein FliE n=1 Tax=Romboutsia timonensis TaxID=1776391 RepID=UPI002587B96B|nr:flagellar hook-basal body complex protein FliE [uncultured Romboutsia sp.]